MTSLISGIVLGCALITTAASAQPSPPPDPSKIQVLIVTGQNVHDWRGTTPLLKQILESTGKFEVRINEESCSTPAIASRCGKATCSSPDMARC
jgi:hypothetical protein